MTFDELYDALRALAEANREAGFGVTSAFGLNSYGELQSGTVAAWTLQPEQIETLVGGIAKLQETPFRITGNRTFEVTSREGLTTTFSLMNGGTLR